MRAITSNNNPIHSAPSHFDVENWRPKCAVLLMDSLPEMSTADAAFSVWAKCNLRHLLFKFTSETITNAGRSYSCEPNKWLVEPRASGKRNLHTQLLRLSAHSEPPTGLNLHYFKLLLSLFVFLDAR